MNEWYGIYSSQCSYGTKDVLFLCKLNFQACYAYTVTRQLCFGDFNTPFSS